MTVATSRTVARETSKPMTLRDKFLSARKALSAAFIERDEEIDLLLIGLVARKNVLFIGEPGVAKSAIQEGLRDWIDGDTYATLMHRSISVEELMGQLSVKALMEEDTWRRVTTGRLPVATVGILDEIFKSSPVCLSPLLKILNERVYEVEGRWVKSPLACVMAASNEWPPDNDTSGIDVSALFDRFLIRKEVGHIETESGIDRLLDVVFDDDTARHREPIGKPIFPCQITPDELLAASEEARAITWTHLAYRTLKNIFKALNEEGVTVSDRRKRQAIDVIQAAAWLDGSEHVTAEHMGCLSHVLWSDHQEHPKKTARVVARFANPVTTAIRQHRREVEGILDVVNGRDGRSVQEACDKMMLIINNLTELKSPDKTAELIGEIEASMRGLRAGRLLRDRIKAEGR